jgi:hypothetical protein
MKVVSRKKSFTKLSAIFALLAFVFGVYIFSNKIEKVAASASGPTPSHTGATGEANCTACHSDFAVNSGTGNVTITGVPANYVPGRQYQLTVRTSQAAATIYGFQMTAIDSLGRRAGTFVLPAGTPSRLQLDEGFVGNNFRQYIEHTVDGVVPQQFDFNQWTFTWTAPATRVGKITFFAAGNAANSDGGTSGDYIYTTSKSTLAGTATSNFDTDDKSDFSVWRPSTGTWYWLNSTDNSFSGVQFGLNNDRIVPGDYDADGKTDLGIFRPASGTWYIQQSTGGVAIIPFGLAADRPVPGDYDGDGKADLALWRPSTGVWFIYRSSDLSFDIRQFGISTDKTAQADYDGDGKTDIAVYRPSTGEWYVWKSSDNTTFVYQFGIAEDKPLPADYDGDGKADFGVFRPSSGTWYVQRTTAGFGAAQFGASGDRPVPTDYDGDGKTDFAVYRNGIWFVLRSSDLGYSIVSFGLADDVPVPAVYFAE